MKHKTPESVRLERERRKTQREQRLWELATDPNVRRLVLLSLIVAYSTHVTRSKQQESPVASALAMTLPTVGIPMLAADAGITDWRALAVISVASGSMAVASAEAGLRSVGKSLSDQVTLALPGTDFPLVSLAGPIPTLQWLQERAID